jgi:hypothetical protein
MKTFYALLFIALIACAAAIPVENLEDHEAKLDRETRYRGGGFRGGFGRGFGFGGLGLGYGGWGYGGLGYGGLGYGGLGYGGWGYPYYGFGAGWPYSYGK